VVVTSSTTVQQQGHSPADNKQRYVIWFIHVSTERTVRCLRTTGHSYHVYRKQTLFQRVSKTSGNTLARRRTNLHPELRTAVFKNRGTPADPTMTSITVCTRQRTYYDHTRPHEMGQACGTWGGGGGEERRIAYRVLVRKPETDTAFARPRYR
jgi:hypothetical protein